MTGQNEGIYKFVVVAKSLRLAIKRLRVAFPRKRDIPLVAATFKVRPTAVEIGLPGAVVTAPCEAAAEFTAQISFEQFKQLESDTHADSDLIRFAFGDGRMTVGSVTVSSPSIRISVSHEHEALAAKPCTPASKEELPAQDTASCLPPGPDPMDSAIGFPLVGAYKMMRLHPDPTLAIYAKRKTLDARAEVEDILDRADKLLKPLGLCRREIEKLLDQRLGLSQ